MSKKKANKKKKAEKESVIILCDKHTHESYGELDFAAQRKVLEIYCRDHKIKIADHHHSDSKHVYRADFLGFLHEVKTGTFRPHLLLFTSWEVFAPLLDRYPHALNTLGKFGVIVKSIQKQIVKDVLHK